MHIFISFEAELKETNLYNFQLIDIDEEIVHHSLKNYNSEPTPTSKANGPTGN